MGHKGNSLFLFHQEKQLIYERIFPNFSRFGKPTGLPHSLSRDFHSFFTSPLVFYENEPSSNQYADSIFDLLVADVTPYGPTGIPSSSCSSISKNRRG